MFKIRFGEPAPERRSVDQLRGIEGARVRKTYDLMAKRVPRMRGDEPGGVDLGLHRFQTVWDGVVRKV